MEKILDNDHNDESKQWHEWPAIVKSNLKAILFFVKQPPGSQFGFCSTTGRVLIPCNSHCTGPQPTTIQMSENTYLCYFFVRLQNLVIFSSIFVYWPIKLLRISDKYKCIQITDIDS